MKETDIRKPGTLDSYLRLVSKDCCRLFTNKDMLETINCPACEESSYEPQFQKDGFEYVLCSCCQTLYVRRRPSMAQLLWFYSQSTSTEYWINSFFRPVMENRREKIFRKRAQTISNYFGQETQWTIGDIGAGFGLFISEMRQIWPDCCFVAIEPSGEQAQICSSEGIKVENCLFENLVGYEATFNLLTAFELFEHLFNPAAFLKEVYRRLASNGYLFITTLNGQGFDILNLWERSKNIYPPCHLNFFNPHSIQLLFARSGFVIEKIETPGQLDWEIVENAIRENGLPNRFFEFLAYNGSSDSKSELQEWIRKNNFSSHMMIMARKA